MNETSKAVARRLHDPAFVRYFAGRGIDIGCGADTLSKYAALFPLMTEVTDWDLPQGDAEELIGIADGFYDWAHSSHCLEHVRDPVRALRRWCEVVRPRGHIVVIVPDEDLYEQQVWPSTYNGDHKHTFTIHKAKTWSPVSINVTRLLRAVEGLAVPLKVELLHATALPRSGRRDDTMNPVTECAIEFVLRRHGHGGSQQ